MGINFLKLILFAAGTQVLLGSGCKKSTKPCASGGYSFVVSSVWNPQKEIYVIGDTIHLASLFPKTLTDQVNSSLTVDYSNSVGILGDITIYYLDTIARQPIAARDSFQLIQQIGSFLERSSNQNSGINVKYQELSANYQFAGALVCKKKGIYAVFISNLTSNGLQGKNCTNAGFNNTLTNSNKNLGLFQYAMNRPPASQYEIDRIYCFRVQ